MLCALEEALGTTAFAALLRAYFARFAGRSITTEEFQAFAVLHAPRFPFADWLNQSGLPGSAASDGSALREAEAVALRADRLSQFWQPGGAASDRGGLRAGDAAPPGVARAESAAGDAGAVLEAEPAALPADWLNQSLQPGGAASDGSALRAGEAAPVGLVRGESAARDPSTSRDRRVVALPADWLNQSGLAGSTASDGVALRAGEAAPVGVAPAESAAGDAGAVLEAEPAALPADWLNQSGQPGGAASDGSALRAGEAAPVGLVRGESAARDPRASRNPRRVVALPADWLNQSGLAGSTASDGSALCAGDGAPIGPARESSALPEPEAAAALPPDWLNQSGLAGSTASDGSALCAGDGTPIGPAREGSALREPEAAALSADWLNQSGPPGSALREPEAAALPADWLNQLRSGRIKQLRPIYLSLCRQPERRAEAARLYRQHRDGYHPIARQQLERLFREQGLAVEEVKPVGLGRRLP